MSEQNDVTPADDPRTAVGLGWPSGADRDQLPEPPAPAAAPPGSSVGLGWPHGATTSAPEPTA